MISRITYVSPRLRDKNVPPFCASLDFEKLVELEYSTFTAKVTLGQAVAVSDIAFWEKWT